MQYKTYFDSPVGNLLLSSDGENLTGLWIENQKYYAKGLAQDAECRDELEIFQQVKVWLSAYFAGENPDIRELPIKLCGSPFQQRVWNILREIPYGKTITYAEIAKKAAKMEGKPYTSARAAGGAVGHNPISIVIPCHRVVGSNGSLTGYAGGIDTKIQLLELEHTDMTGFFKPKK